MKKILACLAALIVGFSIGNLGVDVYKATRPIHDIEVWGIYSCDQLAAVIFVNSEYQSRSVAISKENIEYAMSIPLKRRYYVNVNKHCPLATSWSIE